MFYWLKFPFVRVVLFFALGILIGIYVPWISTYVQTGLISSLIGLVILVIWRKSLLLRINYLYGLFLSFLFFNIGYIAVVQATETNSRNHIIHFDSVSHYIGKVISEPQLRGNFLRMKIEVTDIKNSSWQKVSGKVLVYLKPSKEHSPVYGDILLIKGFPKMVAPPLNPKEFDYRQYLAFNNIHHQDFINEEQWYLLEPASGLGFRRISIRIRNYLEEKLASFITNPEELSVAKALILGKKEDLDKSTKEVYAKAGAMHVLAVSGLHVGIIYLILLRLLGQKQDRVTKPLLVATIVIPALWAYAFITGLSPSVLRAVTMFSFLALAQVFNRRSATLNTLAISAFILLLVNPYMIMAVGFQLSYVAVIGIIYLYPIFENWLQPQNRIIRFIWQLMALSLAAQVATSPLSALYFHRFPTYFLFSNLLVIPAAMAVVWGGMALLFLGFISSTLGIILGKILSLLIWSVNQTLHWIAKLPYADIHNLAPTISDTWLMYALIIFLLLFVSTRNWPYYKIIAVLMVFLSINLFYEDLDSIRLRQIVFYSVNNSWAIDFVEDKGYLSFADSMLIADKSKVDYLLTPYRRYYGLTVNKKIIKTRYIANLGEVIIWHGQSILLANSCLEENNIPAYFDFVLFKVDQSDKKCYQEQILLRKFVNNQGANYSRYNLRSQGAMIVDI